MRIRYKKNNRIVVLCGLIFILSSSFIVSGYQDPLFKKIEQYLKKLQMEYAATNVYVHLDKPYYLAGETIWMKAYLQDANHLKPTDKDQVLYIDLVDASGKAAQQVVLKAEMSKANGSIILPESLASGKYHLTAYTNWMRNFGEENFFHKEIQIWNPAEKITRTEPVAAKHENVDLQFFPEGGDLIAGLPGKVAFKAINEQGQGVSVQGTLYEQNGSNLQNFKSYHLGMGAFEFTPQPGKKYFVKLKHNDGIVGDYPLPDALPQGYTLAIDEVSDENFILLQIRTNVSNPSPLLLTGIAQNQLIYTQTVNWQGNQFDVKVPKNNFPTGIVRFTLSLPSGEPHAERLVFINHQDQLQLTIRTNQQTYGLREKVTMDIQVSDAKGRPVATDLSLSVTDDELVNADMNGAGIISHLLLASDLKGPIEQPNYYFAKSTPQTKRALHCLMLTQGYRRFGWQQIMSGQYPEITFAKEMDISIRGKLLTNKGKPIAKGEVILYLKDQHQAFIIEETNEQGEFVFEGFNFTDTVSLVIQGSDARGRREGVEIVMQEDNYIPSRIQKQVYRTDELQASLSKAYVETSTRQIKSIDESQSITLGDIVLKEIVVESKVNMAEPFKLHTWADVVLRADQLPVPPSGNILEVLQGRVAGLQIYRRGYDFRASIRGQGEPLYLIDGIPVDASALNATNSFDVERVEIIKNLAEAGIYGGRASGGVIALFTKRGGTSFEEIDITGKKYIIIHRAAGFSKMRQFYSPTYASIQEDKQADLRTTIYWNPSVKTDASGKARVIFYTADRSTHYRTIIEGISQDGIPGRSEHVFTIQQNAQATGK